MPGCDSTTRYRERTPRLADATGARRKKLAYAGAGYGWTKLPVPPWE
jgi:hypothetical protein